ncbi:unnamed protein product, partial [Hapterophycus canaliculatus]
VLAAFVKCLLDVLFNYEKSVSDLLRGLSCMAHLALILFRRNKSEFIPGQLYHDLQATIRCAFMVAAQAKHFCPSLLIYLFLLGTNNLENLFAVLRTMTHSRTFSYKELCEKLAHASQVDETWSRHGEWRRSSRRLLNSADHMNTTTWDQGPAGNTSLESVDIVRCWQEGRRQA